ncbi:MAG: tetratricopeptide repeat protein [Deltaproteobacteria bacterium]|nr:tetratricopeptide repeat protein [Deltaproteobacteria bacterium]
MNIQSVIMLLLTVLINGCFSATAPSASDLIKQQTLIEQGVHRLRAGDFDQAEASFRVAITIGPSAAAVDGLGCVAFMRGDFALAEKLFRQAYEGDSGYNESLGNLALLYEVTGRYDRAAKYYRMAVNAMPTNFRVRNNYAVFLDQNGTALEREKVKSELLMAKALLDHPAISENVRVLQKAEEQ